MPDRTTTTVAADVFAEAQAHKGDRTWGELVRDGAHADDTEERADEGQDEPMTDVLVEPDDTARDLREYIREHPDVRTDQYQTTGDPIQGACYVLAEAYFHARGGTNSDLDVYRLDWGDVSDDGAGAHWFLREGDTVIDLSLPTPAHGDGVPWDQARHRAFITGYTPSNRTHRVLDALDIDY